MKLVFCGTPMFAVPTLRALASAGHSIELVVSQPDRPKGRGMEVAHSPVKQAALELKLAIAQPENIKNNAEFRAGLEAVAPAAIIVVGYGRIIPQWMLELPQHGNINLHASLLPRYRGAAPIQWAIANGETVTGNTTMRIDEGLDTGDILLQQKSPIAADDTSVTLAPRLAAAGAELMLQTLRGLEAGEIQPIHQDDSQATLAPILKKEEGRVDFTRSAKAISDRLRGFQPWPGAFTTFRGRNLTLLQVRPQAGGSLPPGAISTKGRLLVGCGEGSSLEIVELQLEGKKRMPALDFINGYQPLSGECLGA